jgi:GT2 family glycosyltransferase
MFRLETFRRLGGFDKQFWYCHENNDFALRAIGVGYEIGRVDMAFVNHRRFTFRAAGSAGDELVINRRGHDEGMRRWLDKWGKPYGEIRRAGRAEASRLVREKLA